MIRSVNGARRVEDRRRLPGEELRVGLVAHRVPGPRLGSRPGLRSRRPELLEPLAGDREREFTLVVVEIGRRRAVPSGDAPPVVGPQGQRGWTARARSGRERVRRSGQLVAPDGDAGPPVEDDDAAQARGPAFLIEDELPPVGVDSQSEIGGQSLLTAGERAVLHRFRQSLRVDRRGSVVLVGELPVAPGGHPGPASARGLGARRASEHRPGAEGARTGRRNRRRTTLHGSSLGVPVIDRPPRVPPRSAGRDRTDPPSDRIHNTSSVRGVSSNLRRYEYYSSNNVVTNSVRR